jgi:hypothetical protein
MARFRLGNRYLSQQEYDAEMDWKWVWGLFLVGSVLTGCLVHAYLVNPDWHKAIRFIVTTVPALAAGVVLVKLRHYIQILLGLAVILLIAGVVIGIISSVI